MADARATKTPQPLVAHPVREAEGLQDPGSFLSLLRGIASHFPGLKKSLVQAQMNYTPAGFIRYAIFVALCVASMLLVITYIFIRGQEWMLAALVVAAPVYFLLAFAYAMQFPMVKSRLRARRIDQELVFAGRHMLIELQSGIPLFDALLGISRDYGPVSEEFNKVVEKVTLGVPLGEALKGVADENSSAYFNRLIMQMVNSLASGSDVAIGLEAALDQISKEQVLELRAYGQKLNPLVMFFMIFGIIMPSLGVAFLIILTSLLGGSGITFGPQALIVILAIIGLMQFLFLSAVESSRPKFDIV
jgi:flagellar protein FlaJ